MNIALITLTLLVAVVLTHWISRALGGRIALPLVQIAAGAVIGTTTNFDIRLDPDLFFFLFLPPLLFLDGWRVPKQDLKANALTILSLATGLVFFTVLCVGLLLHLIVPEMPLSVCFALAAVLSPTDVIAATAMVANVPVPNRLLRILEGEALFNDASGLICLRVAVAVTMTGSVPFWPSAGGLIWAAAGGIGIGLGVSLLIANTKTWIARRLGENTSSQIIISLITPFIAYLIGNELDCSPVLAAITAGMMMSRVEMRGQTLAVTRIHRNAVWETLQFALNGAVFFLLGEQLPIILSRAKLSEAESGHPHFGYLALYVLVVTVALAILRFVWVWISVFIWLRWHADIAADHKWPKWRLVATMSMAGVRGAVTLAGALSLPLALPDGMPFPSRDLVILIAAGVIVVSLVTANMSLPRLLNGVELPPEPSLDQYERAARIAAIKAAMAVLGHADKLDGAEQSDFAAAADCVRDYYQHRLTQLQPNLPAPAMEETAHEEERLRILALHAERTAIVQMVRGRHIPGELARKLLRETDAAEAAFQVILEG